MRKHKLLSVFSNTLLAGAFLLSVSHAGAVVNSTQSRLVFNEDSMAETLVLVNSERAPALVQVWTDDNSPLSPPDRINTPLIVVPPVFKLGPGESRNLRIMLLGRQELPTDRERVYWLNIYQIPPNTQATGPEDKKVIIPLRIRLKVFVRPVGLKAPDEEIGKALKFTFKDGNPQDRALRVDNPTPYNMTLGHVSLGGKQLQPTMIAPKSSATIPVPQAGNTRQMSWSVIDDYGKATTYQRQL
ncbi:fimbria/pilus periplasmic chaperone [Ewingella sp. S1.OA.A_B6]